MQESNYTYRAKDLEEITGISISSIMQYRRGGKLKSIKKGRRLVLFHKSSVGMLKEVKEKRDKKKTIEQTFVVLKKITKKRTDGSNKIDTFYDINCSKCLRVHRVNGVMLRRCINKSKEYVCDSCSNNSETRHFRASRLKKRITNTTGYIGVHRRKHKGEYIGYKAILVSRGLSILNNSYADRNMSEKTLIRGAIDRELFILEKKLPHTRNFTNKELISNMQYLGYSFEIVEQTRRLIGASNAI